MNYEYSLTQTYCPFRSCPSLLLARVPSLPCLHRTGRALDRTESGEQRQSRSRTELSFWTPLQWSLETLLRCLYLNGSPCRSPCTHPRAPA